MSFRLTRCTAIAGLLALGCMTGAYSAQYHQVNAGASQISFTYDQMGQRVYGTFGQFSATLDFDTMHPEAAHAGLVIELASIDAGSEDANGQLQEPGWFNSAVYPQARFESSRVKALGDNRYEVVGQLSLKGITREVRVPVSLSPESGIGVFSGELTLNRADFDVGKGEWAGDSVVSNEIAIKFRVVAPQQ
ncbi:Polyisoprenoid-binding protein YceI [Pseudomonas sp. ok272]|uniref:YceI family protein n=1 Tax=unclassified Pseudomonas TaxID=196821 RepID=UPI0008B3C695|nr:MULTISPECIES: YceI family protein [unclassified Pseudomonas]SEN55941.1 Polyisoprenoid-binding protein YceI [Pseudomonas sp. ok272]SFN41489.1 Polyisoprenoid-binding protein YceI [Pseudomonas sp. ok602]